MMKELSLHVLDIAENSVRGEAENIDIIIHEDIKNDIFSIDINDDGKGIPQDMLKSIRSPFTTTRTHRKVGMGIPFLNDTCIMCGGSLTIDSAVGSGTKVHAKMQYSSIDRPPLGDISSTLLTLFSSYPNINFTYTHLYTAKDSGCAQEFTISTAQLNEILEGIPLSTPSVFMWVKEFISDNIQTLRN